MAGGRAAPEAPQALTSDAWYTLLYLTPASRRELHRARSRIWSRTLVRRGVTRPASEAMLRELEAWKERSEARGSTPTVSAQVAWLSRRARTTLRADEVLEPLNRAVLRAGVRAAPGAAETLRCLADAGVPLGVVSNVLNETGRTARTLLDRAGVLPLFTTVVLSCDHPFAKPRPEPFRLAARFLGVPPGALVHVGDLAYDVRGAQRAGARGWLFTAFSRWNRYLPGWPDAALRRSTVLVPRWSALPALWHAAGGRRD